jgi:GTPase SAR1 family protein
MYCHFFPQRNFIQLKKKEMETKPNESSSNSKTPETENIDSKAHCLLFIGMAGTGKTSLYMRLNSFLSQNKKSKYLVNLDPACTVTKANVDIRTTVDYHKILKEYHMGPNGGILTCLNLFTTKFDQVVDLIESKDVEYVLLDTPGQIELFTWSASGDIITQSLASQFPTTVLYIIDTPRCTNPVTFMSNMLYAVSILYKTKLPFVLVYNKTDVVDMQFCIDWMNDFEQFQSALQDNDNYISTLMGSMSMVLEEFYQGIKVVGVSAFTGEGMDELLIALEESKKEYQKEYFPVVQKKQQEYRDKMQNATDSMINLRLQE